MADDLQKPGGDLYQQDYLAWTEVQARALRARKGGDNGLDYDNLAEEIEDLGRSEQRACESQLENILEHLLKIEFVGAVETIPHWSKELREFRRALGKRLTPTIESRLKPEIPEAFSYVLKGLATGKFIEDTEAVMAARPGYTWEEIVDSDWYPQPRYAGI